MQTLEEENSGEDDLFAEARSDSGKITKGEIAERIKEIRGNLEFEDELKVLHEYLNLAEKEAGINDKIKVLEAYLDNNLLSKYKVLKEEEIKRLVIEDKWIESLYSSVTSEMDRISQKLSGRIKELAERYETPLPNLINQVEELSKKVDNNLKEMGFIW
jgi:type I restriction enzyme M protein